MWQKYAFKHWEPNIYSVFFLGFASGLPFLLILSTLSVWLAEVGISKTMIGLLAWVSVPYSIKFIWGAMIDRFKLPILYQSLGLRRSWIILAQICLWLTLIGLGSTNPLENLWCTALFAFLVGCSSAIQDIAIEAYRIEILPTNKIGLGASISVLGYRFGMLCSGAGTIYLAAHFNSWSVAYNCIAACMLIGIITTLLSTEPTVHRSQVKIAAWRTVKAFVRKRDWEIIIPFILSYKIADTVLNVMSMPFLVEIGFTKLEIASVAKTFGIGAMILGGIVGGLMLARQTIRQNLFTCVVLQFIASALFIMQAHLGHDISFLFISMGVENFTCGMSQVALISYLSHLCSHHSTAMHYAILSSFASFVRVCFSTISGWAADQLAWPQFYSLVCVSCLPSLLLLILCVRHFAQLPSEAIFSEKPSLANSRL
jgi:PAT family beta-lactamase induction signal transducer AmpG